MRIFDGSDGQKFLEWITEEATRKNHSFNSDIVSRQNMALEILELGGQELVASPAEPKKERNVIDEVLD